MAQWTLDEACLITGRKIENALNKHEDPFASNGSEYRSTAPYVKRKVKIKNGIW
jgi:hypothetical protein